LEILTNHEAGLAMRVAARHRPLDIRRQKQVTRSLPPGEMECIAVEPHVLPCADESVTVHVRIVYGRSGVAGDSDVTVG
jgi:hypothetical protein